MAESSQGSSTTEAAGAEALVRRYLSNEEGWGQPDPAIRNATIDEIVDPYYVRHHGGRIRRGLSEETGLKWLVNRNRERYPDLTVTIDEMASVGEVVAVRLTVFGTDSGSGDPSINRPATGNRVVVTCMGFFLVRDDKIVESWHCLDEEHVIRQLGGDIRLAFSRPRGQTQSPLQAP